jgi:hypothetical protein
MYQEKSGNPDWRQGLILSPTKICREFLSPFSKPELRERPTAFQSQPQKHFRENEVTS